MDFKDIKTWGVLLSIIVAIGGGFATFGKIQTRLDQVESRSFPDIKQMEINATKIQILELKIEELEKKEQNPLMQ